MRTLTTPRHQLLGRTRGRPARRQGASRTATLRHLLAAAVVTLLAVLWGNSPAHAHASLLSSEPAAGARLADAPVSVRLVFNEDVTLLDTTRLTGPGGDTAYRAQTDGGAVTLVPDAPLGEGLWDVTWQVVSADGHLVGGVLTFTVGDTGNPPATPYGAATEETLTGEVATHDPAGNLDRVLELLGWLAIIIALGATIARHVAAARTAALLGVVFPVLRILDATDHWGDAAWNIGETRAALAAAGASLLLLVGAATATPGRRAAALLGGVALWSAQGLLSGHPNIMEPRWFHAGTSALHLAGALTWSGAVTAALIDPRRARHASRAATLGIAALVPGAALLLLAFVPAAIEAGAGRWEAVLAAKTTIVAAALLLGWRNHLACRCADCRKLGCACPLPVHRLTGVRRRAAIEAALIVVVAVLTATLTTTAPRAAAGATNPPPASPSPDAAGVTDTGTGTSRADLVFDNGETGEILLETRTDGTTTIHLVLRDPDGKVFLAEQAGYELENAGLRIGGISGELPPNGAMHMGDTVLPGGGTWRITVHATYDTFTTITASADLDITTTTKETTP